MEKIANDDRKAQYVSMLGREDLADRLASVGEKAEAEETTKPAEPKVTRKVVQLKDASGSWAFVALKDIESVSWVTDTIREEVGLQLHTVGGKSFSKTLPIKEANALLSDWQATL